MGLYVPVDDVVVVAVLQGQQNLPDVVATDSLRIDEACCGPFDYLEAQIRTRHELEDHVEHPLGAVRF